MIWSLITLIIYLTYIFIKYKLIPTSISNTFYLGANWLFTLVMWIIGFSVAGSLIPITNEMYQFLPFFIAVGISFVGAAPHFKEDLEGKVHSTGAILFGIAANIWACLYWSPIVLFNWIAMIPLFFTKLRTFWAEIICIINLLLAYF